MITRLQKTTQIKITKRTADKSHFASILVSDSSSAVKGKYPLAAEDFFIKNFLDFFPNEVKKSKLRSNYILEGGGDDMRARIYPVRAPTQV